MPKRKKPEPSPRHVSCWPKYDLVITSFPTNPNQGQSCMVTSSDDFDQLVDMANAIASGLTTTSYVTVSHGESFWSPEYRADGRIDPTRKAICLSGPPAVEGECRHMSVVVDGDGFRCKSCGELLGPEYEVTSK